MYVLISIDLLLNCNQMTKYFSGRRVTLVVITENNIGDICCLKKLKINHIYTGESMMKDKEET